MNAEPKGGLGLAFAPAVALTLCCLGPVALSLVGCGAFLVAASRVWADIRPLLTGLGTLLVIVAILLLAPRRFRSRADKEERT